MQKIFDWMRKKNFTDQKKDVLVEIPWRSRSMFHIHKKIFGMILPDVRLVLSKEDIKIFQGSF